MKYKTQFLLLALVANLFATVAVSGEARYEQKLIFVQGAESRFMKGERKPVFDFRDDEVLPYLLSRGWKIVSVHVNERSKEDNLYGYVVVQREISPD